MRPHSLLLIGLPLLLLSGCSKPAAPTAPLISSPEAETQPASATAATAPTTPPAPVSVAAPVPTVTTIPDTPATAADHLPTAPVPSTGAQQYATQMEVTVALRRFLDVNGRLPNNFEELVAKQYIKKLPLAPPGKRFAIDRVNLQVVLVGQ